MRKLPLYAMTARAAMTMTGTMAMTSQAAVLTYVVGGSSSTGCDYGNGQVIGWGNMRPDGNGPQIVFPDFNVPNMPDNNMPVFPDMELPVLPDGGNSQLPDIGVPSQPEQNGSMSAYAAQVVELVNSEVPVVTIDHVFNNRMAILSDNVSGLKALVRQAWACGHRRIAFIHGEKTAVTENRVAGFYQACEELGLKIPEAYVREGIYHDADRCAAETKALLELPQPPTCIIFPDDFSALGGYNAISEKGLSIPEDVSVMGYDGIYLSRVVKPQLVTYQQNTAALGRTAADKLIELIEHPRVTLPEQIRVSGKLLDGGSVSIL